MKILWSVDALMSEKKYLTPMVQALKNITQGESAEIEPVYVLSPDQLNVSVEFTPPWVKQYKPVAQKALDKILKTISIPGLQKPTVLVQHMPSLRHSIDVITTHALGSDADLIAVCTAGRKGISRFFLGSFAETLLLHSKVPVLVVSPAMKTIKKMNHILFPCDFTDASRVVFEDVIALAATKKAKVTLYHKVPNPLEPVFQSGVYLLGGNWVPIHTYFDKEMDERKKESDEWVDWAKKRGVQAEVIIDERGGSIADSIVSFAKKKGVALVAMASQSGTIGSTILGSVTRQVVRNSPCPVWVLHPKNLRQEAKKGKNSGHHPTIPESVIL